MPNDYTQEGMPIVTEETRDVLARDIIRRRKESEGNEQNYFDEIRKKIKKNQPQIESFIQSTESRYVDSPKIRDIIIQNILYTYELLERQGNLGLLEGIPLEPRLKNGTNPSI